MKDAFSFAWSLYTSNVMPITQAEDIKEQVITSENMGTLYEQELIKATVPQVIENNTSYAKRSSSR